MTHSRVKCLVSAPQRLFSQSRCSTGLRIAGAEKGGVAVAHRVLIIAYTSRSRRPLPVPSANPRRLANADAPVSI
jgi:hypothetical protein